MKVMPRAAAVTLFALLVTGPVPSADAAANDAKAKTIAEQLKDYPERVADFVKVSVRKYEDAAGEDVSIGYNYYRTRREPVVIFTTYFYPLPGAEAGRTVEQHNEDVLNELKGAHRGLQVVSTGKTVARQHGVEYQGLKTVVEYRSPFGADGAERELRSEVHLFQVGKRLVKYRVSYPVAEAEEAGRRVQAFEAEFVWPEQ